MFFLLTNIKENNLHISRILCTFVVGKLWDTDEGVFVEIHHILVPMTKKDTTHVIELCLIIKKWIMYLCFFLLQVFHELFTRHLKYDCARVGD